MFNRTFYKLQTKKALWGSSMLAIAAYTIINTTLALPTLIGFSLGVGMFSILPLLPTAIAGLVLLASPFIALTTPYALAFNLGFLGIIAHRIMQPSHIKEAFKNIHPLGKKEEEEDLAILQKLENKIKISIHHKKVCNVEGKKPNAAALGGFVNNTIYIFSNLMKDPFTLKERKAVYAHEFGHLKHWDFLTRTTTNFLWYTTVGLSLASFSLPIAIIIGSAVSISYYAISQIDELLADQCSAQYANPKALISTLEKLVNYKENKPTHEKKSLWDKANSSLSLFKKATGMISHPDVSIRKAYLSSYAKEKQSVKTHKLNAAMRA